MAQKYAVIAFTENVKSVNKAQEVIGILQDRNDGPNAQVPKCKDAPNTPEQ